MRKNNTINIGTMQNSQVQQDVQNSKQTFKDSMPLKELGELLHELHHEISKIQDKDIANSLFRDIEKIRIQSASSTPKKSVIKECLTSLKATIEGATGNILASYAPALASLTAYF